MRLVDFTICQLSLNELISFKLDKTTFEKPKSILKPTHITKSTIIYTKLIIITLTLSPPTIDKSLP